MTTLRRRLREETRPAHDRLDGLVSGFDLQRPEPLTRFLAGHHAGMRAIRLRPGPQAAEAEAHLADLVPALGADLRSLGVAPDPAPGTLRSDGTAALYVLLGSRLGAQVLRSRWEGATDPSVRSAGRYFRRPFRKEDWHRFCEGPGAAAADAPGAEAVVRDALCLFGLFEAALTRAPQEALHD